MPDYHALKAEIAGDAYRGKPDGDVAAMLNAPGPGVVGDLAPADLMKWGAASGVRAAIEAGTTHASTIIRSICYSVRDQLTAGSIPLSVGSPEVQAMVGALVSAGVMTAGQSASLTAAATRPGPSRASAVWGGPVDERNVSAAREFKK